MSTNGLTLPFQNVHLDLSSIPRAGFLNIRFQHNRLLGVMLSTTQAMQVPSPSPPDHGAPALDAPQPPLPCVVPPTKPEREWQGEGPGKLR